MKKTFVFCITFLFLFVSSAHPTPDEYLPELGKDYVYWRTKTLIYSKQGETEKTNKARKNFQKSNYALSHGGYTEKEIYKAIKDAEDYYQKNPIRP